MAKKRGSFSDRLFTHALLLVSCLGFPAATTWLAPVTWTTFTRHDGRVEMNAKVCLFFILPFRHENVAEITGVDQQTLAGTREKWTSGTADDQKETITTESQGSLVVHGREQEARIAVSPVNLSDVAQKVSGFLNDPTAAKLSLFTVANWKTSVVAGCGLSLLTVLYIAALLSRLLPASSVGARPVAGRS
jgi:hypothetical protein